MMAAELGDMAEAPVDYQDYASEAEELADLTADNRIAELATTNNKLLAEVFADLDTGEIPFMLSGYTEEDYGNIVTALSEALHTEEPKGDPTPRSRHRPSPSPSTATCGSSAGTASSVGTAHTPRIAPCCWTGPSPRSC